MTTDSIKLNKEFTVAFATKSDKVNAPVIDQLSVTIECKVIELQEEFKETRVVAEIWANVGGAWSAGKKFME